MSSTANRDSFEFVLLGSEQSAYNIARAFWHAYGIKATVFTRGMQAEIRASRFIGDVHVEKRLGEDKQFVKTLVDYAKANPEKKKLLLPNRDGYVQLIARNYEVLSKYYTLSVIPYKQVMKLGDKAEFYKVCEKYGLDYPKTHVVSSKKETAGKLEFPVIVKASEWSAWAAVSFATKKKIYLAKDPADLAAILAAIYDADYKGEMILQEYIPGIDSTEAEIHAYSSEDGKVRFMQFCRGVLGECRPDSVGSYAATMTEPNDELLKKVKKFLEGEKYNGISNFDLKYDARDGKWKIFEINCRLSRSSYAMVVSGHNFATMLGEELIYGNKPENETEYSQDEIIYTLLEKWFIKKYVADEKIKKKVLKLWREGKVERAFIDKQDVNPMRFLLFLRNQRQWYKTFKRYFGRATDFEG